MNKETYTPDGMHPEDAIYKAKTFINELQEVQETYFNKLVDDLKLTKEGETWLFDYIYNSDDQYDGFDHYLQDFKKKYIDFIKINTMFNSNETFLPTDFGEFSPMLHMSSYEADLETAFPSPFNDEEPVSLGLETVTFKNSDILKEGE